MTMNLTVLCKRITGLLILIFIVSVFSLVPVQAATKKECKNYLTNAKYVTRYNVSIDEAENGKNKYVIKLAPKSSDAKLQKALRSVVFKVVKINDTQQDGSKTVKYNHPLTLSGHFVKNSEGDQEMMVTLESTEENADPKCTGKVTFKVGITKGGEEIITDEGLTPVEDEYGPTDGLAIDCSKEQTAAFEKAFCQAKNLAKTTDGGKYYYDNKFVNENKTSLVLFKDVPDLQDITLKCDVKKKVENNNYYVNKKYFYGSGEYSQNFGNYKYHYSPGVETTGDAVTCKVKCEETVVVEYGPPIASKAGLCFEYKVKVTSRVSCSMSEKPKPPKTPDTVCTPTPLCKSSEHSVIITNQGGPAEDFDACIKKCDGGKYTDKCSEKCYKQIYGKTTKKKTSTTSSATVKRIAETDDSAFSLATCIKESEYGGCYYRKNGGIYWSPDTVRGRWYAISPHKDLSEYKVFENGIYRHVWADGGHCHDICWWSGCSDTHVYINPGIAKKDKEANEEIYDKAVEACKATATCTTTTADFTISVSYTDSTNVKQTINFPYTETNAGKDHLTSRGKDTGIKDTSTNKNTTLLCTEGDETGDAKGNCERGCYSTKDAYRIYRAEWSFPGSWINNKTGEISFINKDTDQSWQKIKEKFCIPLDAKDVNREWWNWYYYGVFGSPNYEGESSIKDSAYQEICKNNQFTVYNDIKESDIEDWNITATTRTFGFFGWNVDILCFYALNTNPVTTKNDTSTIPKECLSDSSYRIRSVDLSNLFPATDGSNASRAAGFNWSKYSTLTKTPTDASVVSDYYVIKPSDYANKVQKLGDSVYSDEHLDYSINLTRSMISSLRSTHHKGNYTDYSEDLTTDYVIHYKSPLFRSGGILSSNAKYPNETSLKCNNMKKYNGLSCEE